MDAPENRKGEKNEDGLQIGFTIEEMANRLEGLLRSIGLLENFADLIMLLAMEQAASIIRIMLVTIVAHVLEDQVL